jgi:hypothetical protein
MKEAAAYCVSVLSQMNFSAKQEFIDVSFYLFNICKIIPINKYVIYKRL